MQIKKWLETNSFHYNDFQDIDELVRLKEEQNLTISLGLPTKNVEQTLEPILFTIQNYLQEQHPLLDEIAIIDGHSTDKTVEIAKEHNVEVYFESDILPEVGRQRGKGEALWKSLAVLKGDIIAWIDSDIRNIDPRFVYGIVGPIIKNKNIDFVKAHYRRPIKVGESLNNTGGGRVTELVTRPIFNLFYPELAAFAQPLSGEYAGRRSLLETLPFYTGYAVETGLLVEILRSRGLDVMAQVDLEERIHDNQPLSALGRMAFEIQQAVFELLQNDEIITLQKDISDTYKVVSCSEGKCTVDTEQFKIVKRTPMIDIPFYKSQQAESKK